jgi:hypothetical protein
LPAEEAGRSIEEVEWLDTTGCLRIGQKFGCYRRRAGECGGVASKMDLGELQQLKTTPALNEILAKRASARQRPMSASTLRGRYAI